MINKVKLEDKDRFYELGLLINSNFMNLYNLNNIINSLYDMIYGYYENSNLVGFIHINKMYETVDIINIVVDVNFRNKGIATKLINYITKLFDDVNSIMLEVNENNMAAINLYKKSQFYEINRRPKYYGEDTAIIMKRDVYDERC